MAPKKEPASPTADAGLAEEFHDSEEGGEATGKLPPVPESPEAQAALGEEADVRVIIANLQERHEV